VLVHIELSLEGVISRETVIIMMIPIGSQRMTRMKRMKTMNSREKLILRTSMKKQCSEREEEMPDKLLLITQVYSVPRSMKTH